MKRILLIGVLFSAAAGAQVFDPNPEDPEGKMFAEARFIGAILGMMPPPVGWLCTIAPDLETWALVECYPDPALIEQQEEERKRFYDEELRRRTERFNRRR